MVLDEETIHVTREGTGCGPGDARICDNHVAIDYVLEQPCEPPCAFVDDSRHALPRVELGDELILRGNRCECCRCDTMQSSPRRDEWQASWRRSTIGVVTETAQEIDAAARPAERAELIDHEGQTIDIEPIRPLLARISARWHPVEVWLFGSRARGDASSWSDWDLFVVLPDDSADAEFHPLVAWRLRKDAGARVDIVLCRATDFREDRSTHNTLAFEAVTEGVRIA